jgi:peptide-methionine (R)-S-oxide reductase
MASDDIDVSSSTHNRRDVLQKGLTFGSLVAGTLTSQVPIQSAAVAKNIKSRTAGYDVQHTEVEWSKMLSKQQYFILREGGTESPYSSILEGEERAGIYLCAGCQAPLFDAKEKFHSGTGWPSFASPLMSSSDAKVSNVEMEDVSTFQYQLAGAEVRCHTCGGHLGDVFADGFLFVGKLPLTL